MNFKMKSGSSGSFYRTWLYYYRENESNFDNFFECIDLLILKVIIILLYFIFQKNKLGTLNDKK